jgi:hypothetical protein
VADATLRAAGDQSGDGRLKEWGARCWARARWQRLARRTARVAGGRTVAGGGAMAGWGATAGEAGGGGACGQGTAPLSRPPRPPASLPPSSLAHSTLLGRDWLTRCRPPAPCPFCRPRPAACARPPASSSSPPSRAPAAARRSARPALRMHVQGNRARARRWGRRRPPAASQLGPPDQPAPARRMVCLVIWCRRARRRDPRATVEEWRWWAHWRRRAQGGSRALKKWGGGGVAGAGVWWW